MKSLIFLELNEINFDAVKLYIKSGLSLPGFEKVLNGCFIKTTSETEYHLLEPWIQWPSIHTGMTYKEHQIFRLGDFVNSDALQIFEKVEQKGFSVGAISAMNSKNNLRKPAYFIPDPWTQTTSDGSFLSKSLHQAISQAVNDNSESKLTLKSILSIGASFFCLVKINRIIPMLKFAFLSKGKSWRKALFLDMLLFEVHQTYFKRKNPNFSTLFLNAGAHIQHHYFFNSKYCDSENLINPNWYLKSEEDPFEEMLMVYDAILQELLEQDNCELVVATGLSQKVHEHIKFYYRLKNHDKFLTKMGISFKDVKPRMTRDFLISFDTIKEAKRAEKELSEIVLHGEMVFGEIDNRGVELFVVLTYDKEITESCSVNILGIECNLLDLVTFVAIKNGEHQSRGYAFFSDGISRLAPADKSNVTNINKSILDFFDVNILT